MLPPETGRLWRFLEREKALAGFVLVGGTALAMHLDHRVSEDLDFMIPEPRLPRGRIDALRRKAARQGHRFVPDDRIADVHDFVDAGLDLHDYQQNFIVSEKVKVTLVAPDPEVLPLLRTGSVAGPRVASLDEIFRLKCMACANRTKTRDWVDLFVLIDRGLFAPLDIFRTFELVGAPQKFDIAMARLCSGRVPASDEGYRSLMPRPPSLATMKARFLAMRREIEIEVARVKGRSRKAPA